jgi:hypothetical protein
MQSKYLRKLIVKSIKKQGFGIFDDRIKLPGRLSKERLRKLHGIAVKHQIEQARPRLERNEDRLLARLAAGSEVDPQKITPALVEVQADSDDELLFRYACKHWSIPVSSGYGRRLRFLVIDQSNGKLMGLFGLCDPVYSLRARDQWIGWNRECQRNGLRHVMDAFVLGAVPPYSFLLCGKLIAMLLTSNEVRTAFQAKYGGRSTVIKRHKFDGTLALITTASALGRSSIYNRVKYLDTLLFRSVGFTEGSGDFHFANGVYSKMLEFAEANCKPTAKQISWGTGFRNKREVIKKCLSKVGLSSELVYHGVKRELFVIPLGTNVREFLSGGDFVLNSYDVSADALAAFFKNRWLLPRSQRDSRYLSWAPSSWKLWPSA